MQIMSECWSGCGEDIPVNIPAERGSPEIVDGVPFKCPLCGEEYNVTVDGDGEAELISTDESQLGQNVTGHGADEVSHG